MALDIVLVKGPRRGFLMREVPMYGCRRRKTTGYEPFTPHASTRKALYGGVIKKRG